MIDEYSYISQEDLDRLEKRRLKMEREKVAERQTLRAALLCSEVIDDTFSLTEKAVQERDIELKGEILTVANKAATMAVKLQQIHMMRAGLLPPMSANKETQQAWEQKAINQYEAEREKRRQARVS